MKVSDQAMLDIPGIISQKPYLYVLLIKSSTVHFQTQSRYSGHLQRFVFFTAPKHWLPFHSKLGSAFVPLFPSPVLFFFLSSMLSLTAFLPH